MKLSRWMRGFRKSFDDQLSSPGAVITIAKATGCVITADDLKKARIELLEEELDGVVGGTTFNQLAALVAVGRRFN